MSITCCTFRGGHLEKQEKQQKNEKMKPKVRRQRTSKSDEPDLQESAFLKKIIAYQRKLLVNVSLIRHHHHLKSNDCLIVWLMFSLVRHTQKQNHTHSFFGFLCRTTLPETSTTWGCWLCLSPLQSISSFYSIRYSDLCRPPSVH